MYHTKALVSKLLAERGVLFVCDVHAHSRKDGLFMYSCVPDSADTVPAVNSSMSYSRHGSLQKPLPETQAGAHSTGSTPRGDPSSSSRAPVASVTLDASSAVQDATAQAQARRSRAIRLFPRIMAKVCSYFRLEHCNSKMTAGRTNTMRVVSARSANMVHEFAVTSRCHDVIKSCPL